MATLFVRHDVADFGHWRQAYDDFDDERASMGVTGHGVFQEDGNPNNVTVYHEFESMDSARTFASSPRLQEVMRAAGVQGEPVIWFADRA